MMGVTFTGNVTFQGPMFDIHDNEHVHIGVDGLGKGLSTSVEQYGESADDDLPTKEEMQKAIAETVKRGLWWSSRSWAVVYRVYQMKGYMNGFTQFAREVKTWSVKTGFECNYDAIQKPITKGVLAGNPEEWVAKGAQKQAVNLANALLDLLNKKV